MDSILCAQAKKKKKELTHFIKIIKNRKPGVFWLNCSFPEISVHRTKSTPEHTFYKRTCLLFSFL